MENISGKSRARFRWMLSCVTIGIAVIVSPCFAADLGTSQGTQRLGTAPAEIMPFRCDSLDPKVCFDIYRRRMEQRPEGNLYNEYSLGKALTGHRLDWPWKPWNTAIDERHTFDTKTFDSPDSPKDWFTAMRRVPWRYDWSANFMSPGLAITPKDLGRIK
jgi:hypothetical protein